MSRHLVFAIMLTLLLLIAGLVMVPVTQGMPHEERNMIYSLVRVPIILGSVWAYYGTHINPKRVMGFSLALTLVIMGTGVLSIPAASNFDPAWQNFFYTVGRVPLIFVMAYLAFSRGKDSTPKTNQWKRMA
jgi:peptidoglycan/LPS O-acetylase OafA/YrhL